jgi:2-aminoadipate transaminase
MAGRPFAAGSRTLRDMADQISFARGAPSLDIIDVEGLKAAAAEAFASDPGGTTAYGTAIGYPPLRKWIAERHQVAPENVIVTNGSMQADAFLFDALVEPGDSVIVERPTYDRTLLSLRNRGADVRMVELETDGIDVAAVERVLAAGAKPKLAHIIPNFQNPAGYTLSAPKRERLLELARTHEFTVFEDDPYVALRFEGTPLETMLSMDGDTVVYASSFSKTVCPGIRVGYLVGPAELIARIVKIATNTYISPSMVSQAIVYNFCTSGALGRSIDTVKAALRERAQTLCEALRDKLPDARFEDPQGGYFLWVDLPRGTDVGAMFTAAAERGLQFVKGSDFVLEGGDSSLRLAYAGVTPEQIEEGVDRLADAYREATSGVTA